MTSVLILGAGIYQVPFIQQAKKMGLITHVVSRPGQYPGISVADNFYPIDTTDIGQVVDLAKTLPIKAVMTSGSDVCIPTLGAVNEALKLPGLNYQSAIRVTDKLLMKNCFAANAISTPPYRVVSSFHDVVSAIEFMGFPTALKVVDSSGSRGVEKLSEGTDLSAAWERIRTATRKPYLIVEKWLDGLEFGAQVFVWKGKVSKIFLHNDVLDVENTPIPIGHSMPFEHSFAVARKAEIEIEKVVKGFEIENAVLNVDFLAQGGNVYILEFGARAGATCLVENMSTYLNANMYEKIISMYLGSEPKFTSNTAQPNASRLLFSRAAGVLRSFDPPKDPNLLSSVVEYVLDYEFGERVPVFRSGADRIGHVVCTGNSTLSAEENVQRFCELGRIEVS